MSKPISQYRLIIAVSLLMSALYNFTFFKHVVSDYSFSGINIIYTISVGITLFLFITFVLSLLSATRIVKPLLITVLMVSSFTAYFMDTYNVVIDHSMIRNAMETNFNESYDLLSFELVLYVIFLGLLPSYFVYKVKLETGTFKQESVKKLKVVLSTLLIIVIIVLSFSKFYTSFFREHKHLKYYANPTFWMFSSVNYIKRTYFKKKIVIQEIGAGAAIHEKTDDKKELVIMVVGEATRADRFSLNGYERETNPMLKKEEIYNFSNIHSCGTSTAESVPCMFSVFNKGDYSYQKGISTENVLDVLTHTKQVHVLWRDNNSSSKGVALRVEYEDYQTSEKNTICEKDGECRDEGMLVGLEDYIAKNKDEDILIVLHQMGNHGPAYYKRYPKEFEKFTPVCKTNQLEKCTQEQISNAYDNAILHTDSFLSKVINFLKPYSKTHETAMVYMADHGESLGENGLYLHGLPYFMAPETQTHVASLMWFGESMKEDFDIAKLNALKDKQFSQDNLFHTLLGMFEVETKQYKQSMDMLSTVRPKE